MSAAIIAYGAISALGEGERAAYVGDVGDAAPLGIARDRELEASGLGRPFVARAAIDPDLPGDRATTVLSRALGDCLAALDATRPGWRALRVGLALGTSSGGMRCAEELFTRIAHGEAIDAGQVERAHYAGPMLDAAAALGMTFSPATLVLAACASSVIALGIGARWLDEGACDLVLAGGFDAVSVFVAAGFETLKATTEQLPPKPFRIGRGGMALGEGAAILALVPPEDGAIAYLAGFGAAADAVHLTAPDRTGAGLARAANAALVDAGITGDAIDLVSAHATATPFNDAAESKAIAHVLGPHAGDVPVHPFKAQIGHTLGAAGALETLACVDAFRRGVLPAAAGHGVLDPEATVRLLERTEPGTPRTALKLSSAFGGANAALVVTRDRPRNKTDRTFEAYLSRAVHVGALPPLADLAARIEYPADRLSRSDPHCLYALAAIADLQATHAPLAGAGIIVGTAFATIETNARFAARIRERGARMAEPRRFPYTSPNAVAGECGVVFQLSGPSFAVGLGMHAALEAIAAAATLVRAGDAERIVVVAVDDIGDALAYCAPVIPRVTSGAVALVVSRSPEHAVARFASCDLALGPYDSARAVGEGAGHAVLLPLTAEVAPASLQAYSVIRAAASARGGVGPVGTSATVLLDPIRTGPIAT